MVWRAPTGPAILSDIEGL